MIDRLKITYNKTALLQQEITALTKTFRQTTNELTYMMFTYNKFLLTYISLINQRIAALTLLQAQALEYLQDITLLLTNKISPRLVPITSVQEIFSKITQHLIDERSSFFIINPDPTHFYNAPNFIFYASDDYIYLQPRIPLSSHLKSIKFLLFRCQYIIISHLIFIQLINYLHSSSSLQQKHIISK